MLAGLQESNGYLSELLIGYIERPSFETSVLDYTYEAVWEVRQIWSEREEGSKVAQGSPSGDFTISMRKHQVIMYLIG
jgi:hypothetical protein